jgi:hypothetical protein
MLLVEGALDNMVRLFKLLTRLAVEKPFPQMNPATSK